MGRVDKMLLVYFSSRAPILFSIGSITIWKC